MDTMVEHMCPPPLYMTGGIGGAGGNGGHQGGSGGSGEGARISGYFPRCNIFVNPLSKEGWAAGFREFSGALRNNDAHRNKSSRASPYDTSSRRRQSTPDKAGSTQTGRWGSSPSPPLSHPGMDTLPIQTYTHQLLRQQRGYPLYNTGPQLNLPDEYRETGVSIGDVGTVTADGIFDFYFNIFLPCNHPINAGRVPDDFVPLQSYTLDDVHQTDFQPGSYVSSPYPFFQELNSERSWDQFPGSALSFMCTGPTGALLALQCGSRLRQLKNVVQLRQHAEKYAESWYKYVNGPRGRGRGLPNGSLYLITGCEKSQAGGMATFNNVAPGEQFPLSFEPSSTSDNLREGYRFRRGTPAHTKTFMAGRSEGGDGVLCNQTAFLHGFSISLGDSIWERLLKTVKVNSMTDFALANLPSSVMPLSSITSSFFGPFGPEEGHGGSHRAEMCTTLSPLSSTPTLVHPSQIINDYILREDPEATVVLTHDDDWAEILLDDGTENVVRSVSEFLQRVSQRFQIEGENGARYLRPKSKQICSPAEHNILFAIRRDTEHPCNASCVASGWEIMQELLPSRNEAESESCPPLFPSLSSHNRSPPRPVHNSGRPSHAADSSLQPPAGSDYSPSNPLESVSFAIPSRILIYQSLLSFLQEVSQARAKDFLITSKLHEHHSTMSASDSVSALVKSCESRAILLQAASDLDISNDPKLRKALHEDETRIATHLMSIMDSQAAKEAVLALEGDAAQHFLDVIQHTLDRGLLIAQEHNSKARRMIVKLSQACDKLPSSLFITGVGGRDHDATFSGGFSDIYRGSYGGKTVALKHIRTNDRGSELRRLRSEFCREALIWQQLEHPNILPMIGIDHESFPSLCMVSPWMKHGTVLKYLEGHGRQNMDKLLLEVAQGLEYLHSRNVVHGDLRGANILITQDWSACLADFGLTSFIDTTAATTTSRRAGSIRWMAPELIDPDRFGLQLRRTKASDIYAFGCVCFELFSGRPPFADIMEEGVIHKSFLGERPARPATTPPMSDALWNYVNGWWAEDPATRPPIEVVVRNVAITQPRGLTNLIEDTSNHDRPSTNVLGTTSETRLNTSLSSGPRTWKTVVHKCYAIDSET